MTRHTYHIVSDVLMIALVTFLPHVAEMPMIVYPPVLLLVLWLYLKWKKQSFDSIGFRWRDLSLNSFFIGSAIGVAWALTIFFVIGPFILYITGLPPADLSDFQSIKTNLNNFISLLAIAWLLVIPYEEIMFRGFVFSTLRRLLNKPSYASGDTVLLTQAGSLFWLAGVVHSAIFAAYHWQEGGSAVISIFIGAMFTVFLYKLFKGNLWYLIFFHAAYDTVMLSLFRYGYL